MASKIEGKEVKQRSLRVVETMYSRKLINILELRRTVVVLLL